MRSVTKTIQKFLFPGYFASNDSYPKGACGTCCCYLFLAKKNGKSATPPYVRASWNINCSRLRPPSRSSPCNCSSWKLRRFKGKYLDPDTSADLPRKSEESLESTEGADAPKSSEAPALEVAWLYMVENKKVIELALSAILRLPKIEILLQFGKIDFFPCRNQRVLALTRD